MENVLNEKYDKKPIETSGVYLSHDIKNILKGGNRPEEIRLIKSEGKDVSYGIQMLKDGEEIPSLEGYHEKPVRTGTSWLGFDARNIAREESPNEIRFIREDGFDEIYKTYVA